MSAARRFVVHLLAPVEPRPKYIRRLHSLPDPDLEGLSAQEQHEFKIRAKAKLDALIKEAARLFGEYSNYDAAERILGDRHKEGTIRSWRDAGDVKRYPRSPELKAFEMFVDAERARQFAMVNR